jgi:hypothetical protein
MSKIAINASAGRKNRHSLKSEVAISKKLPRVR